MKLVKGAILLGLDAEGLRDHGLDVIHRPGKLAVDAGVLPNFGEHFQQELLQVVLFLGEVAQVGFQVLDETVDALLVLVQLFHY